jgi:hypothetical protein
MTDVSIQWIYMSEIYILVGPSCTKLQDEERGELH